MSKPKVLLTGATSPVSRFAAAELLKLGVDIRVQVHKLDERSEKLASLGAEVVVGDFFSYNDARAALNGIASAFFLYPIVPHLIEATAIFAQAALDSGTQSIVNMSQISAREDAASHAAQNHWIAERIFDRTGISTTHLRPTFFAQWLLYPPFLATIKNQGEIRLPFGKGRHAPIAAEDQGRLVAKILSEPISHAGKTYNLHGPVELDQDGIAKAVGATLGRSIKYIATDLAEFQSLMGDSSNFSPFLVQHLCAVAIDYRNGIFAGYDDLVEEITGIPALTVEQFVALNRASFNA